MNGRYIRGYGIPKYEAAAAKTVATSATTAKSTSVGLNKTTKWTGKVTASVLNVRIWSGTEYSKLKSYPQIKRNTTVEVCDR